MSWSKNNYTATLSRSHHYWEDAYCVFWIYEHLLMDVFRMCEYQFRKSLQKIFVHVKRSLDFLKQIYLCSYPWEAAIRGYFQNKVVLRSTHEDAFFSIAVLYLWINSLKNNCDGVWFSVNLHLMLSDFEPLLQKFKYFITALINEQLLP